ncbi:hypothetical protein ADU59_27850 [Pararhizobium polonicum]|uniref:STAS domain-containing protein n=1 Tax=Pararhizobium polonicum TaxID=1612624 RepID=A0A1C7NTJ1_9HYPH|nr:hypothetical protein [Pararhizobium polonicum]OBZ92309.1 hypothetical protein ADU59_27850 [Pararhizobium polonicum]
MDTIFHEYDLIDLPGKLNIRNINNVHDVIYQKLKSGKSILISVPKNAEADLSFVQIIESARIQAKSSGIHILMSNPAEGSVLDVLERGGFKESFSAEDKKFWLHQEAIQ